MEGGILDLLPKEIWAIIFQFLDDYDDVLNMSIAFPEMELLLVKVNGLGLFEKAIPHIAEWLSVKALLRCRRVGKQWMRGVDQFLEDLPSLLTTYEGGPPQNRSFQFLRRRSTCGYGRRHNNVQPVFRRFFMQSFTFLNGLGFEKFLRKMDGHPPDRNPFLGRVVTMDLNNLELGRNESKNITHLEGYWAQALRLLREWGKHIWYFELRIAHEHPRPSCQYLKESLALLPNLRGLTLAGHAPWYFEMMDKKWKKYLALDDPEAFPKLPSLVTFNSSYRGMPQLGDTLMTHYSTQLTRLQLSLVDDWTWGWTWGKEKYAKMLPNLTELEITSDLQKCATGGLKDKAYNILLNLNTPKLQRLLLKGYWSDSDGACPGYVLGKEDVLRWMRRFPCLSYMHLPEGLVADVDDCAESSNGGEIPVKILSLHVSDIKLTVYFPEVEFLHIYLSRGASGDNGPLTTFRRMVTETELAHIWEHCPKLSKVYIEDLGTGAWEQLNL